MASAAEKQRHSGHPRPNEAEVAITKAIMMGYNIELEGGDWFNLQLPNGEWLIVDGLPMSFKGQHRAALHALKLAGVLDAKKP